MWAPECRSQQLLYGLWRPVGCSGHHRREPAVWLGGALSFGLEAVGLVRTFGGLRAVDGVSFQLQPGELLTVFGPNGAGKTTLLRMLGGVMKPTSGQVRVSGAPANVAGRDWRHRVGFVSHQSLLYGQLTTEENLRFYGRLFGLKDLTTRIPERLESM